MAENQVYLIKSGQNSFVEETEAVVGISGGKVGIGTTAPEADLHVTGSVKVGGDLAVDGTFTTINSSTVSVDDKNIELGSTANPTDVTADGGGITVKGATDKTFNWLDATDAWTSSEHLHLAAGKGFAADKLSAINAGQGLILSDTNGSGILVKGGKVGIHQATPVYDLDVDGSGNFTSLYVDGNAVLTGEGSIFGKWEDGTSEGEIFYTGGNVGVGTDNPEHKLHIVGDSAVDGNFVVNGTSGNLNVSNFNVSGDSIVLNYLGDALTNSRGGLIVKDSSDASKSLEYVEGSDFWLSSESMQIVADKHLQTDKVRAIDDGGLYLQDDGGNGIHIQDGGQVNIAGLTKANGGLNVGNGKFDIQSDGTLGSVPPNTDDVIKWNGTKWVADVSPGGGGGGSSEVPSAIIDSLIAGESIQEITYGPYDSTPRIATDLEIVGDGSVIPYALSGVSETGYFAVFSQEIPNNNYKIHTVFGGKDVYWETGSSSSIYYNDGDVSLQRNLTVGGNLTVAGNTTTLNTQTLEIEDHNIVIASNTGYNQLTDVYPVGGDYAGVFWGTGDAGAASPVSLTYQSNKGFAFEGGKVGIGTTGPVSEFQVGDKVGGDPSVRTTLASFNASDNAYLEIENTETKNPAGIILTNVTTKKWTIAKEGDGHHLYIKDAGDDNVMTFLQGGNVGIGTASPDFKLEVGDNRQIQFLDTGDSGQIRMHNQGYSNENVRIHTNGKTWFNGGNVGIGTTNPISKLHVDSGEAELTFGNNASGGNANLRIWRNDSSIAIDNPLGYLSFAGSDAATSPTDHAAISAIAEESHEYTSDPLSEENGTQLTFFTTNLGQSAMSRKMTISANGNVGIGTTNPGAKLEVSDATNDNLRIGTRSGNMSLFSVNDSGANAPLAFEGSQFNFITGNVGIGTTTSTDYKLDVHGWIHAQADALSTDAVINLAGSNNNNYGAISRLKSTSESNSNGASSLTFSTRDSNNSINENMRIDSAGNVGIGTTNPGGKLHANYWSQVTGTVTVSVGGDVVTGTDTLFTSEFEQYDTIKINGEILYVSTINSDTSLTLSANHEGGANDSDAYKISEGLWVGEVTEGYSAAGKLGSMVVDYNGLSNIAFTNSRNDAYTYLSHNGDRFKIQNSFGTSAGKTPISLSASGGDDIFIKTDGNVGIGTADPTSLLDIQNDVVGFDVDGHLVIQNANSEEGDCQGIGFSSHGNIGDGSIKNWFGTINNGGGRGHSDFIFLADNTVNDYPANLTHEIMRIAANGRVGIGTTNPDAKLHVNESVNAASTGLTISNYDYTAGTGQQIMLDFGLRRNSGASKPYAGRILVGKEDDWDSSDTNINTFMSFNVFRENAIQEKMRIDSDGNVGIGHTGPSGKLHVTDLSVSIGNVTVTNTGTGVTGGTDLNTKISNGDRIKINGEIFTVSAVAATTLTLSGTPSTAGTFGAYTDNHGLVVTSAGNVGIGTTNPGQKLVVEGGQGDWVTKLINTNASPSGLAIQFTADIANASNDFIRCFKNTSDIRFRVYSNGTVRANATEYSSDDRIKHNEQPIIGALETLSKITPKKYIKTTEMYDADHDFELDADGNPVDSNGEPVEHRIEAGVIAQQVLTVDELAFAVSPEGVDEDGTVTSPHGLDYNSLFTYAIAAIQEQQQLIDDLKSQNESLAARISALES